MSLYPKNKLPQYVLNNETDKLPYVLEFFENIFSKEERRIVNSLIDNIPIEEKCEVAKNHFDDLTTNINQFLGYYIGTIQELKVALTLDYAFRRASTKSIALPSITGGSFRLIQLRRYPVQYQHKQQGHALLYVS